jgi:hypothetical protein
MKAHFDAFVLLEHTIPVEPSLRVQMNRDAKIALFRAALNERLSWTTLDGKRSTSTW